MRPKITLKYLISLYDKEIDKKLDEYLKYHNTLPIEEQIETIKEFGRCLIESSYRSLDRATISCYTSYFALAFSIIFSILFYTLGLSEALSKWVLQMLQ